MVGPTPAIASYLKFCTGVAFTQIKSNVMKEIQI